MTSAHSALKSLLLHFIDFSSVPELQRVSVAVTWLPLYTVASNLFDNYIIKLIDL